MLRIVLEMETGDPDDFITLLFLLGHPGVDLRAVLVTPGSSHQVGLVRRALEWFGRDLPVGAYNLDHEKTCVSGWHYKAYGEVPPSRDAVPGGELLLHVSDEDTTVITGSPPKNLGVALARSGVEGGPSLRIRRLIMQGGFAGEGVVPRERQLEEFRGRTTCPSFNLNGDPKAVLAALAHPGIGIRRFVSKNVCHGVFYDRALHERLAEVRDRSHSLAAIWKGMDVYLGKHPAGKKFHDPLAACCAIDESIGTWAEVELYRERGEWGARLSPGSGTWIIVDYDREKFVATLTAA